MSQKYLLVEQQKGICTPTLNRPDKKNSLSLELVDQFGVTLKKLAKDDRLRVINLLMQTDGLDNNQAAEARTIFREALSSEDMQEGQAAFLEKRKPYLKGK